MANTTLKKDYREQWRLLNRTLEGTAQQVLAVTALASTGMASYAELNALNEQFNNLTKAMLDLVLRHAGHIYTQKRR